MLGDVAAVTMGQSPPSVTINEDGVGLPFIQGNAAAILSSMDDAIEKSAQSVARLPRVKSGLMGCLLTGQVRVTADTVASAAKRGGWGRGAAHPPRLANR